MEWRDIPGFRRMYQVSDTGLVRSRKTGHYRVMSAKYNKRTGYEYVTLRIDSKPQTRSVHRLVASAFLPNPGNLPEVNHIDENKRNNAVENLEWCTRRHNHEHSKHKLYKPVNVFTPEGELLATFTSSRALAGFLGVSKGAVTNAIKRDGSTCCGFVLEHARKENEWVQAC